MSRMRSCKVCGADFGRANGLSHAQWEARLYCSMACAGKARAERNAEQRGDLRDKFESRFTKGDGCWNWEGTIGGYGYGVLDFAGHRYRAHALALDFAGRPVPKGMVACHHCDNPRCVRPDHLYVGTVKDNVHDAMRRNRNAAGIRHGNAKLTPEAVRAIRSATGTFTDIARQFGISRPTAARVIKGVLWRSVQ